MSCRRFCLIQIQEIVDSIEDKFRLKTSRKKVADKFGLALVNVLFVKGTILRLKGIIQRLQVVFVWNRLHSFLYFFIAEPKVTEHLPYLYASPMIVTEFIVAVGSSKALVVDVLLLHKIVHNVVCILNRDTPQREFLHYLRLAMLTTTA